MYIKNNFYYMLAALLIFLVVIPITGEVAVLSQSTERSLAYSCLLVIGVWSLRGSGAIFKVALLLMSTGVALSILDASPLEGNYVRGSMTSMLLFLILAIWASLKQVLFSREVNANRVVGAVCVYLLLGSAWAVAYLMIETILPGSFAGSALEQPGGDNTIWIYFSFVTLTTLGYGDVTPVTGTARVAVYVEAIFGIFYMSILVASIVSAYAGLQQNKD